MMIISADCWQCEREMKIALSGDEEGNLYGGPERFSEVERALAEQHGVLLRTVFSKTAEKTYVANVCKECGAHIGKFYFFAHCFAPALYGDYGYEMASPSQNTCEK